MPLVVKNHIKIKYLARQFIDGFKPGFIILRRDKKYGKQSQLSRSEFSVLRTAKKNMENKANPSTSSG